MLLRFVHAGDVPSNAGGVSVATHAPLSSSLDIADMPNPMLDSHKPGQGMPAGVQPGAVWFSMWFPATPRCPPFTAPTLCPFHSPFQRGQTLPSCLPRTEHSRLPRQPPTFYLHLSILCQLTTTFTRAEHLRARRAVHHRNSLSIMDVAAAWNISRHGSPFLQRVSTCGAWRGDYRLLLWFADKSATGQVRWLNVTGSSLVQHADACYVTWRV